MTTMPNSVKTRHVYEETGSKVVETFRTSGEHESRKGTPFFGCCTLWIFGAPFFLFGFSVILVNLGGRREQISNIELWFFANIIEGYVEPFLLRWGLFVLFAVVAIGLLVDFVYIVPDWKRGRRRRGQLREK